MPIKEQGAARSIAHSAHPQGFSADAGEPENVLEEIKITLKVAINYIRENFSLIT
ncbi:MAG: hypothetical protein NXY59_02815 [Aigarchaeota archaeon]|nr:hypothetical protein [Candidatus Pelearchaeum maunauluense]